MPENVEIPGSVVEPELRQEGPDSRPALDELEIEPVADEGDTEDG